MCICAGSVSAEKSCSRFLSYIILSNAETKPEKSRFIAECCAPPCLPQCLMPTRTILKDLKDRIPILFRQGLPIKEICILLGIKKSATYAALCNQRLFGMTTNLNACKRRRHHILDGNDLGFIQEFFSQHHTVYLGELQEAFEARCQIHVSVSTPVRTLKQL